jgi:hemolysin activation/secretion protein
MKRNVCFLLLAGTLLFSSCVFNFMPPWVDKMVDEIDDFDKMKDSGSYTFTLAAKEFFYEEEEFGITYHYQWTPDFIYAKGNDDEGEVDLVGGYPGAPLSYSDNGWWWEYTFTTSIKPPYTVIFSGVVSVYQFTELVYTHSDIRTETLTFNGGSSVNFVVSDFVGEEMGESDFRLKGDWRSSRD